VSSQTHEHRITRGGRNWSLTTPQYTAIVGADADGWVHPAAEGAARGLVKRGLVFRTRARLRLTAEGVECRAAFRGREVQRAAWPHGVDTPDEGG